VPETFPFAPKGVIFDCDGVMIDSRSANIGYYNLLLKILGKPPLTKEQEDYAQMATARQAVEQVMTEDELARLPDICARYPYKENTLPTLRLEPYFAEFARWLKGQGVRLAVHTNRGGGVWDVLDHFGISGLFDIVMNVQLARPKPDPDGVDRIVWEWGLKPEEICFVGDSDTDMGAANGAGVPFVAYKNPRLAAVWHTGSFLELKESLKGYFAGHGGAQA